MKDFVDEIAKAQNKLDDIVRMSTRKESNHMEIGKYIDKLSPEESKTIIKMISYGSWEQFKGLHD